MNLVTAQQNVTASLIQLALLHAEGKVCQQDYKRARHLLELAANDVGCGCGEAEYALGMLHRDGKGGPPDCHKAYELFFLAARNGHAKAQLRIDVMHLDEEESSHSHGRTVTGETREAGKEALPLQVQEHPLTVVSVINVLDSVEPVDDSSLASSSLSVVSLPCDTQACGTVAKRTLAEEKRGEEPRTAPLQHSGKGECPVGVDGMGLKDQEGWILPALL